MENMEHLHSSNSQIGPSGCKYGNKVDEIQRPKFYLSYSQPLNDYDYFYDE